MTLADRIDAFCIRKLGCKPNLESPRTFNDKIQWLKLHDQRAEQIAACDKLEVRNMVANCVGERHLLPVFESADRFSALTYRPDCIVKATHDSGTTTRIKCPADWSRAGRKITAALLRPYGVEKGEWAYARIAPRCFTEKALPDPVLDYKFHCVRGEIKWVQIIGERDSGHALETITDANGKYLPLHLYHGMRHAMSAPPVPETWREMCAVARRLSQSWRYVRVDLYSNEASVFFGEMTFWPGAGAYRTSDNAKFGEMLDIDMSWRYPPIVE